MLCKGRFKPRQTFEPPQLSPGRLTTAVAVAAPSNVHPRHRTSRLLGWLQVSQPVRCSLRSCQFPAHEKRLGSIDVYCLGWSIWRDKEHQCQTNHLKQGKYLKVFKISKDFQDHSGIFRHIQEQIDDEFFLKQLNWWMEHGTQTTLNIYIYITNLRSWPNYARPLHSFGISRWPLPNYPPQCYCRPSQELANRPGHTCQRRNDLRSFGLQQLKYRLRQRFKQRQLEQERQPLTNTCMVKICKNVANQIK